MPREALLPLVLGEAGATLPVAWPADARLAGGDGLEESDVDLDRRGFGTMMTGVAAAAMLPELTMPARVTASHVRYLKTCVDNLTSRDQVTGGGALLKQAMRQWQRARRMLDESGYTEPVGRDLLGVTGNLALTAGWLAFDAANIPLAKRMYSEALLLAEGTDDPILKARVLGDLVPAPSAGKRRAGCTARESSRLLAVVSVVLDVGEEGLPFGGAGWR